MEDISIGTQLDVEVTGIIDALKRKNEQRNPDGSFSPGSVTIASIVKFAGQHLGITQKNLTLMARLFREAAGESDSVNLGNLPATGRQLIQQNRRRFEAERNKYK